MLPRHVASAVRSIPYPFCVHSMFVFCTCEVPVRKLSPLLGGWYGKKSISFEHDRNVGGLKDLFQPALFIFVDSKTRFT